MSTRALAAVMAGVFMLLGVVSFRDVELVALCGVAAAAWWLVALLSPPRPQPHRHDLDWGPHPVDGLTAATCRTCGERVVF